MCENIRDSVEAKIKQELKRKRTRLKPGAQAYWDGYHDALTWVMDLFYYSNLDAS